MAKCINLDKIEPLDPVVRDQYKQFKLDVTLQALDSFRQGIPKKILYFNNLLKLNHTVGRLFFANDLDKDSFKPTICDISKRGREGELIVPSHRQIVEELERIKDEASELIEMVGNIKLWIQLNIPRIEDGNNFGVGIQEEVIQELARVEDSAFNLFDAIVKYYMARAKLSTKVIKYPNVLDYQEAIRELDEKEWIHTKIAKVDMRNNYSMLYELLSKNWEKVVKPKSEDAHSHMTF
ncbi:proteasome activator subunit 2 (PA28 beta) [Babesia microti strain RI]|uniref:Proteasome activator subunit 2 (PA28 beta) n=1 Tax=Babesia microti (strain RI) TaxID=1133968 RepID=I7IFU6_BABMR|nr:proteasome activator subunit 2 (PA28 beta) [Babesia microti strain RI]CCF73086.1 proteasome activator subunit 2 (PA28 beta) [Babesia microti strain RI]|eukprot:XP_012647695.1 proteasome activator subunit 2 (PA28 beta) [Babesia microti strain RI]